MSPVSILPPTFDPFVASSMGVLAVIVAFGFVWLITTGRAVWRTRGVAAALTVLVVTGSLAWSGRLARFDVMPPPMPVWLVWAWNLWGCWSLAMITFIAVATSPMVHLFGTDPGHLNTWVLYFPYVWLPAILVTTALAGHVMVTGALLVHRRHSPSSSFSKVSS